jgi:hypothetical protein
MISNEQALAATYAYLGLDHDGRPQRHGLTVGGPASILTLDPVLSPCVMHRYHSPRLLLCEAHHIFPKYMQELAWGEVRDQDKVPACPTGHTNLHLAIADILAGREWRNRYSHSEIKYAATAYKMFDEARRG